MSDKIFDDYHGASIKINGVCYKFVGETTSSSNSVPGDIEGFFASCLECALESSSSSLDSSSSSSFGLSESSSSSNLFSESSSSSSGAAGGPPPINCSGDPDMILSVSGHSSNVTWCGTTWTVDEQGVQKRVCPTTYVNSKSNYTVGPTEFWTANHRWSNAAGPTGLSLRNGYGIYEQNGNGSYIYLGTNNGNRLSLNSIKDLKVFGGVDTSRPFTATFTTVLYSALNKILGVPNASYNNYGLTSAYFGSHTTGGVTYTWSKGNNWP